MQKRREPGRRKQDMKVVSMDELKRNRQTRSAGTRAGTHPDARRPDSRPRRAPAPPPETRQRTYPVHRKTNGRYGLAALLVMLALLAVAVLLGLQIFQIRGVTVTGDSALDKAAVQKLSGIQLGENIFKISLNDVKKKVEADPLLEVQRIRRVYPDKITIEVRQRKPHAAVSYLGSFLIVDEKCIVLDERSSLPTGQYPLIAGLEVKPSEKGRRLQGINAEALDVLDRLLTALYDGGALKYIGQIDMKNILNIAMLSPEGLRIEIGKPEELQKKAEWIAGSIPELRKQGHTKGTLYITGANSPVYSAEEDAGASPTGTNNPESSAKPDDTATPDGDQQGDAAGDQQNQQSNGDGGANA